MSRGHRAVPGNPGPPASRSPASRWSSQDQRAPIRPLTAAARRGAVTRSCRAIPDRTAESARSRTRDRRAAGAGWAIAARARPAEPGHRAAGRERIRAAACRWPSRGPHRTLGAWAVPRPDPLRVNDTLTRRCHSKLISRGPHREGHPAPVSDGRRRAAQRRRGPARRAPAAAAGCRADSLPRSTGRTDPSPAPGAPRPA
jgi:hypothetical protein